MPDFSPCRKSERGAALMLALFVLILLLVISIIFLGEAKVEKQAASNQADSNRAFLKAQSGLERGMAALDDLCSTNGDLAYAPQLLAPFKDTNGISALPPFKSDKPGEIDVLVINRTGKLDPNYVGRPSAAAGPWPYPTLGRSPRDVDFKYLQPPMQVFGSDQPKSGALFTGAGTSAPANGKVWVTRDQLIALLAGQTLTRRELDAEDREVLKNQDELFPYSPTASAKKTSGTDANTFRNPKDLSQVLKRVPVAELRRRVMSIPLGSPVFTDPVAAQAAFDYWFGKDGSPNYYQMHVDRVAQLQAQIPQDEAKKEAMMADPQTQADWAAREPLRSERSSLQGQNNRLKTRNQFLDAYLADPNLPADRRTAYETEKANNQTKITNNQARIDELSALIDPLNDKLKDLDSLINTINGEKWTLSHDQYIVKVVGSWQEGGVPTIDNIHQLVLSRLKNANGEDDLPWLTDILNAYYQAKYYGGYLELLANLHDFFDADHETTTVDERVLPPDEDFDKTGSAADWRQNMIFYAGNERGPCMSELQFRIKPRWTNIQRNAQKKMIRGTLVGDIEVTAELVNFYRENPYKPLSASVTLEGAEFRDAQGTPRILGRPISMIFRDDPIQVKTETLIPGFLLGVYGAGTISGNDPALALGSIRNLQVRSNWLDEKSDAATDPAAVAGESGSGMSDRTWLLLQGGAPSQVFLGQLVTDLDNPETSLQEVVRSYEARDPRCNTSTPLWTATPWTTGSIGSLGKVGSSQVPLQNADAEPNFAVGQISTAFVRDGEPKSLWELGAVSRAEPGRTLRIAKEDSGLLDQLSLEAEDLELGETENGKVNPNTANLGTWTALLGSLRMAKDTLYPKEAYGAEEADASLEIGTQGLVPGDVVEALKTSTYAERSQVALKNPKLTDNGAIDRRQEEIVGKVVPLLQTRYQYFEIISTGRELKENEETGGYVRRGEQTIRAIVERDAYTNKLRIVSQELLEP